MEGKSYSPTQKQSEGRACCLAKQLGLVWDRCVKSTQSQRTFKECSVAERFKALTRNREVASSSPLPAGHV